MPLPPNNYPLSHAIRSIFNIRVVQQQIGNKSRFGSVIPTFSAIQSNLSIVEHSLNSSIFHQYSSLQQLDLGGYDILEQTRFELNGLFTFLRDLSSLGLRISSFGIDTAQTLQSINQSLLPLASSLVHFPRIPSEMLHSGLEQLNQTRNNATILQKQAASIEEQIGLIASRSNRGDYGLFSEQANEIVQILRSFQLVTNANNFYHLNSAAFYLLMAIIEFQQFDRYTTLIDGNITRIDENRDNTSIINNATKAINTTIEKAYATINHIESNLTRAEFHINHIENMPEATVREEVITSIQQQLDQIQDTEGYLPQLQQLLDQLDPSVNNEEIDQLHDLVDQIDQSLQ